LAIGARGAEQVSRTQSFAINNNINRAFAATLGITYQLFPDTSLYLRRAGSFRFPKADENASTPPGVNGLRTQRGVSYEAGMQVNRETYSGKISIFKLDLKDEIAFDPTQTPLDPFGTNRNLSPTTRTGFTLSGKKQVTERIKLDGQYNFVNARFQNGINAGNQIPLVSENIIRAGVNYRLAEHWSFYTDAIFTGSQYAANDDANVAGKNGGYTTYNFNVRYEYQQFSAALHVNNIFDKFYYLYTTYQPGMGEFFYPAPGRNFTLTLNYLFG
jgi:iron complex outermembrane receptor protein